MDELVDRLSSVVGSVVVDSDVLEAHRQDAATFCTAGVPLVLVRPSSTAEVQEVVRAAGEYGVPIVTQGARTGLSGAANAIDGCILLSTARMNQVLEVSVEDQVAVVQPGVINADLSRAVLEQGLFYPPDPSSWEMSTVGGNIATNAGGLCCVKYGVTGDFVRGLEVVLASGEVIRTGRRTVKGVAGYDLTHVIVGSEGTLGIVTEATLALRPAPEAALTAAATFLSIEEGVAAAAAVMGSGLRPSLLEFIDGITARAIQDYRDMGLPANVGSLLLAQSDRGPRAAEDVAAIAEICTAHGAVDVAVASDAEESAMLLEARRLVHFANEKLGTSLIDDVAVPRSQLVALLHGIDAISKQYGVLIACPGHIGDGNMHPTVIFDQADEAAQARALEAFGAVMDLGLSLGGTITGEHGVGKLKRQWLAEELGPVGLQLQRDVKAAFDPRGLLNPDKLFL
ncbi:FAD-binding oxidoreductase [Kribbella italica]|uniref:Glycolate oxidase n=1 Tax=Kribbella italica TaxID=1540520 RepID=A0A7W9MWW2_9ACTN|nr:FAD-linked oxidase C-terminal domain-containing protein [Kribbella italica]MBB5838725.1 glycolate oxidase [Kribbella italica]